MYNIKCKSQRPNAANFDKNKLPNVNQSGNNHNSTGFDQSKIGVSMNQQYSEFKQKFERQSQASSNLVSLHKLPLASTTQNEGKPNSFISYTSEKPAIIKEDNSQSNKAKI